MILADVAFLPSSEMIAIGVFFVTLAAIAKGTNEVMVLLNRLKDKPPASQQVREMMTWASQTFATKEELTHAKELFATTLVNQDTRITSITTIIAENERRHEQRAIDLHNRINPLLEVIGAMRERILNMGAGR